MKRQTSMKQRLYLLLGICLIPLTCMIVYLLVLMNSFSERYDSIVTNITRANAYNIVFKEDMDYLMYIIVVNAERAEELVDIEKPQDMIDEARDAFLELYDVADSERVKKSVKSIVKSLNTLEDRVEEIEEDALVSGSYDVNMERLDLNVRVLAELIQEQPLPSAEKSSAASQNPFKNSAIWPDRPDRVIFQRGCRSQAPTSWQC